MALFEMAIAGGLLWGFPALLWSPKPLNVAMLGAALYGIVGAFQKCQLGVANRLKGAIAIGVCGAALAFFLQAITFFSSGVPLITSMIYAAYLFSVVGAARPDGEWESLKRLLK